MGSRIRVIFIRKALVMLMFLWGIVNSALAENGAEENDIQAGFTERDNELLSNSLNYLGYDSTDRVYRTEFVEVEGQDNVVSLIYDDEQMIGEYVKLETENGTYESFLIDNCKTMYELFTEEKPVVDGKIVNLPAVKAVEIQNAEIEGTVSAAAVQPGDYEYIDHAPANYLVGMASEGGIVLISNVENSYAPGTTTGICWAACGASVVNYFRGTNYTAVSMYNKVKTALNANPVGSVYYIEKMFDLCNTRSSNKAGKLSYFLCKAYLSDNSPIFCMIYRENGTDGHAVVLCGVFKMYQSYGYLFMDPNVSGKYVLNYMDYSVIRGSNSVFSYYDGMSTPYTEWSYTFYNFY